MADRRKHGAPPDSTFHRVADVLFGVFGGFLGTQLPSSQQSTTLLTAVVYGAPGHQPVSYTHLRAHETRHDLVCRLLLEKKKEEKKEEVPSTGIELGNFDFIL